MTQDHMSKNHRAESEPTVTVRRVDGAYRAVVTYEDLEATHLVPLGREAAWNLAAKVSAAFAQGRELNLAHWDFEPIEWQRRG